MELIEKDWKHGTRLAYTNVEPELLALKKGDRVLPASNFYTPGGDFTLKVIHPPGEFGWPEGGYEVYEDAALRCFYLDEIILHPLVINHTPTLVKIASGVSSSLSPDSEVSKQAKIEERIIKSLLPQHVKLDPLTGRGKRGRPSLGPKKVYVPTGGQRGRVKLSDEEKQRRIEERKYVPNGGKRGRKPLSDEEKAKRVMSKAKQGTGKRGRPRLVKTTVN